MLNSTLLLSLFVAPILAAPPSPLDHGCSLASADGSRIFCVSHSVYDTTEVEALLVQLSPRPDAHRVYPKRTLIYEGGLDATPTRMTALKKRLAQAKPPLVPETNVPVSKKLDGTDLATGIGLNFNHPSGVTIRSEFEYFDIGELEQSYLLSFSAIYNF